MAKMRAAVVARAGAEFEIEQREIPVPGTGQVRVRVQACGICFSDHYTKDGLWPGIVFPRVPGHEVAGVIDQLGTGVTTWNKGQRVGIGWYGGHDGTCEQCRRGDFALCSAGKVTGISYDGGYQEYLIVSEQSLASIPDGLDAAEAAPLLCAGITTFNALRHSGARPGDLVAIQGIGGLGHLGIQFANKLGYRVAAVSRGKENQELAKKLGAHEYVDSAAGSPAVALQKLGGARVVLATAPSGKAMSSLIDGLGPGGKLVVVGASSEPIEVSPIQLIGGRKSIQGWPSGTAADSQDTLRFAQLAGVRTLIERFPLEKVNQAYERMASGKAQYRVVLTL